MREKLDSYIVKKHEKRVEVARANVIFCAIAFVDASLAAMTSLEPSDSAAANAEAVELRQSVQDYRLAVARRALL